MSLRLEAPPQTGLAGQRVCPDEAGATELSSTATRPGARQQGPDGAPQPPHPT